MPDGSKLINDLSRVPNIIASLGLAIAEAQRQFNLDYVNSLNSLAVLAASLSGQKAGQPQDPDAAAKAAEVVRSLLLSIAPPRYQFTETELAVKLDLAQSVDIAAQAGLGFGFSGVVVNASFALGYSSDYRAAAHCKTTIHAVLPGDNQAMFTALLERAKALDASTLTLPQNSTLDPAILAASTTLVDKVGVKAVAPKEDKSKKDDATKTNDTP